MEKEELYRLKTQSRIMAAGNKISKAGVLFAFAMLITLVLGIFTLMISSKIFLNVFISRSFQNIDNKLFVDSTNLEIFITIFLKFTHLIYLILIIKNIYKAGQILSDCYYLDPRFDKRFITEIIGTPKRIGNIEIAEQDLPIFLNWFEATLACAELGNDWRLPTMPELLNIHEHKAKIGGLTHGAYWSSLESGDRRAVSLSFLQDFYQNKNGDLGGKVSVKCGVRAVRSIE